MQEYKLRPIKFLWQLLNRTISEAKVYILGYRSYIALLTQVETDPPTAIVLENTLGEISYGYEGAGVYNVLSNGLFTPNKTWFMGSAAPDGTTGLNEPIAVNFNASNLPNSLSLIVNGGDYPSGRNVLNLTPIEIRVYN
jgi:hypothetical protein